LGSGSLVVKRPCGAFVVHRFSEFSLKESFKLINSKLLHSKIDVVMHVN